MIRTDADTDDDPSSRQLTLDDLKPRCKAIAASTGERCRHDAVAPFRYCGDHMHLRDDVDRERMRRRLSNSRV